VVSLKERVDTKIYLTHFPVESYLEADILSKESTWQMMEFLRKKGATGVTADEVSKKLDLPLSVVYSTLKELYRLKYIFVYPREMQSRGERKKRFVCDKATWGKYGINQEFADALSLEGEIDYMMEKLRQPILETLGEVYGDFAEKKPLQKFLPMKGGAHICVKCGASHEAIEFFYALLLRTADILLTESDEFRQFLIKHEYAAQRKKREE